MNILEPQIEYLLLLQNFRDFSGHIFDGFFVHITTFGELTIPLLVIAFMYWCIDKKCGVYMLFNLYTAVLVNQFVKLTACIYRPWILDSRIKPIQSAMKMATGYSFPSGHTAIASGAWGAAAVYFWNKKIIRYFLICLILFIGFSRNYLGVHTPQDVIVSLILGVCILLGTKKLLHWIEEGKKRDTIVYCVIIALLAVLIFYTELKSYPVDYLNGSILVDPVKMKFGTYPKSGFIFGIFTGWILDRKFINYLPEIGSIAEKILRFLIGALVLLFLVYKTEFIFISYLGRTYGIFLNNIIAGLFVTGIYPYIISLYSKTRIMTEAEDA